MVPCVFSTQVVYTPISLDCCVKLWNLDALLSKPEHAKEALLATLSSHEKYVNVVRWSKDGKFLASGSDDNYVFIYKYTPGSISNQSYGISSVGMKNKENWSRYDLLVRSLRLPPHNATFHVSPPDATPCKGIIWIF